MELRPISIWRPRREGAEAVFARPEPGPFGDHYADRAVIPLRCATAQRLCWFGESAAAGYLLAPHWTPAKALQSVLGSGWDVVDLARTNERVASLGETLEAAEQLRPDVRVIFVGNNWGLLETVEWSPYYPSGRGRSRIAEALADGGVLEPAKRAAGELRSKVESLFERIARLGGRTIVVVPEVNLADWRNRQPVPWLVSGSSADRYRCEQRAWRALESGDWAPAARHSRRAIELDGGTCPSAYGALATALVELGRPEDALAAYRAEVDSARYPVAAFLGAPQADTAARELLTAMSRRHGMGLVDLGAVLSAATSAEGAPGRRWFYDYCHLTPAAIDLLAGAVARVTLDREPRGSIASSCDPTSSRARQHRSLAEAGAAIHGAHRGARGEILRHWLSQAVTTWNGVTDRLVDVVAARASGIPAVLTAGQLCDPCLTPQQGWEWPHFDAEVVAAIADTVGHQIVQERLDGTLRRARIELWNPLERCFAEILPEGQAERRAVLQILWPVSDFVVVAPASDLRAGGSRKVELILRLPERRSAARVLLSFDGVVLPSQLLSAEWRRLEVELDLQPGLHRLRIRWPWPIENGAGGLQRAIARLRQGWDSHLCPVFGEVASARVVPG